MHHSHAFAPEQLDELRGGGRLLLAHLWPLRRWLDHPHLPDRGVEAVGRAEAPAVILVYFEQRKRSL